MQRDRYKAIAKKRRRQSVSLLEAIASEQHDIANEWLSWVAGEGARRRVVRAKAASECVTLDEDAKREVAKRLGLEISE
jgi:hypothetical protein